MQITQESFYLKSRVYFPFIELLLYISIWRNIPKSSCIIFLLLLRVSWWLSRAGLWAEAGKSYPFTLVVFESLYCALNLIQGIVVCFIISWDFRIMFFVQRKKNIYPVAIYPSISYVILTIVNKIFQNLMICSIIYSKYMLILKW